MPLNLPAVRFVQKHVTMYLVVLPIRELDFCSIDQWEPKKTGKWKGYQRGLVKSKIAALAQYLERDDGILPVAGLLNVRQKNALRFSDGKGGKTTTGTLTIPDDVRLWVVDMQHRLEGIKEAHSKGVLSDFAVPALITEGLSGVEEAAQFYIINTRSTKMGVDLTRRLLIEHEEIQDVTDVPAWELKAVRIAMCLNQSLKGNPWYGRIREPESERMRDHIATEKSFVPSLKWLLTAPKSRGKSPRHLAKFLANYWEGVRLNIPDAFVAPRAYLLQKTPGYMALHRLAPIVYRKHGRGTVQAFARVFRPLGEKPGYGHRFWDRKNHKGVRLFGTGQSAYSNIALELQKVLGL